MKRNKKRQVVLVDMEKLNRPASEYPRTQCMFAVATDHVCHREATRTWKGVRVCEKHYERIKKAHDEVRQSGNEWVDI